MTPARFVSTIETTPSGVILRARGEPDTFLHEGLIPCGRAWDRVVFVNGACSRHWLRSVVATRLRSGPGAAAFAAWLAEHSEQPRRPWPDQWRRGPMDGAVSRTWPDGSIIVTEDCVGAREDVDRRLALECDGPDPHARDARQVLAEDLLRRADILLNAAHVALAKAGITLDCPEDFGAWIEESREAIGRAVDRMEGEE